MFVLAPLVSGVPTVNHCDVCCGGVHDGNASGVPCVRFGTVHCLYAGTTEAVIGVAPWGRGCVASAWLAYSRQSTIAVSVTPSFLMARIPPVLRIACCRPC